MAGQMVPLRKESGGCTLEHDGEHYTWAKDGDVVEVPYEWALELLAIRDGGFEVADEKQAAAAAVAAADAARGAGADHGEDGAEHRQVIEPAPGVSVADRVVTEPAPSPDAEVSETPPAPTTQASPIRPKARAGTQTRSKN